MYTQIDPTVSEAYSITPYGACGFEVQRGAQKVISFTQSKQRIENWRAAVAWCQANPIEAPAGGLVAGRKA